MAKTKPPWLKQKMGPDGKPMMKDGKPVMESARAVDGLADTALTAAETQRSAAMAASEARSALMAHVPLSGEPSDEQRTAWEEKATTLRADVATKEATYRTASEAMASADREHRAAVTADAEAQAEADREPTACILAGPVAGPVSFASFARSKSGLMSARGSPRRWVMGTRSRRCWKSSVRRSPMGRIGTRRRWRRTASRSSRLPGRRRCGPKRTPRRWIGIAKSSPTRAAWSFASTGRSPLPARSRPTRTGSFSGSSPARRCRSPASGRAWSESAISFTRSSRRVRRRDSWRRTTRRTRRTRPSACSRRLPSGS